MKSIPIRSVSCLFNEWQKMNQGQEFLNLYLVAKTHTEPVFPAILPGSIRQPSQVISSSVGTRRDEVKSPPALAVQRTGKGKHSLPYSSGIPGLLPNDTGQAIEAPSAPIGGTSGDQAGAEIELDHEADQSSTVSPQKMKLLLKLQLTVVGQNEHITPT